MTDRLIDAKELAHILGIAQSTIWRWLNSGTPEGCPEFPVPVRRGTRFTRWKASEVEAFLNAMGAGRPTTVAPAAPPVVTPPWLKGAA